jgi:hypothetical protein
MNKIEVGCQVKNIKQNTIHIVECIEFYESITVIYTTDSKCFPFNDLELYYPTSNFVSYMSKLINGEKILDSEKKSAMNDMTDFFKLDDTLSPEDFFKD